MTRGPVPRTSYPPMAESTRPELCPQCGGPNSVGATVCQWCHSPLETRSTGYQVLAAVVPPKDRDSELVSLWPFLGLVAVLLIALLVVLALIWGY